MEFDLLHPDPNEEKQKHKLKKLVQKPNSFFLDIKCKGCGELTHTFSCAQSIIKCKKCSEVLATPSGGKIVLKEIYRFENNIKKENGSIVCRELLGLSKGPDDPTPQQRTEGYYRKRPCPELCACAARILAEHLGENEE